MAANGGQIRTSQARQACVTCKNRKKRCNRLLPSCAYCVRKELDCVYTALPHPQSQTALQVAPAGGVRPPLNLVSSRMILSAPSSSDQITTEAYQDEVYHVVLGIIHGAGQSVDDISARYFRSFHPHLPIVSRICFYYNIVTSKTAPAADLSILLLAICLTTQAPAMGYQSQQRVTPAIIEQQSLYLAVRSLFTQVQVTCPPSVPLIQAGILLAVYDYLHSRPDDAFATLAGCTRLAYGARIHTGHSNQTKPTPGFNHNAESSLLLETEEAVNTWWGLVICERIFFSELTVLDQPLLSTFPEGDSRLPIEPQVFDQGGITDPASRPNIPVSCMTSSRIGGFGRTAQAVCLLDQVLKALKISDVDSRLLLLDGIDTNIQAFLSLVMPLCRDQLGVFCMAMNIAIRALFILHEHITSQNQQGIRAGFRSLSDWQQKSREALGTVTKMVVDIAELLVDESSGNTALRAIDSMPPTYPYIARAALRYLYSSADREDSDWQRKARSMLQTSLDKYFLRWGVATNPARPTAEAERGHAS